MKEKLESIKEDGLKQIKEVKTKEELDTLKKDLMGKKSGLSEILKSLGSLEPEERKEIGMKATEIRELLTESLSKKEEELLSNISVLDTPIDLTLPGKKPNKGVLHPITQMVYDLNDAFLSLGFEVFSEDDISSEKFVFDNLNFAPDHPARQMMDTYWIEGTENKNGNERLCMRPHLTEHQ